MVEVLRELDIRPSFPFWKCHQEEGGGFCFGEICQGTTPHILGPILKSTTKSAEGGSQFQINTLEQEDKPQDKVSVLLVDVILHSSVVAISAFLPDFGIVKGKDTSLTLTNSWDNPEYGNQKKGAYMFLCPRGMWAEMFLATMTTRETREGIDWFFVIIWQSKQWEMKKHEIMLISVDTSTCNFIALLFSNNCVMRSKICISRQAYPNLGYACHARPTQNTARAIVLTTKQTREGID